MKSLIASTLLALAVSAHAEPCEDIAGYWHVMGGSTWHGQVTVGMAHLRVERDGEIGAQNTQTDSRDEASWHQTMVGHASERDEYVAANLEPPASVSACRAEARPGVECRLVTGWLESTWGAMGCSVRGVLVFRDGRPDYVLRGMTDGQSMDGWGAIARNTRWVWRARRHHKPLAD